MGGDRHKLFLECEDAECGFHGAGHREAVAGQALGAADVRHASVAKDGVDGAAFADIAGQRGGGVGVDVVHVVRMDPCIAQRGFHGAAQTVTVGVWNHDIIAVGSLPPPEYFGKNRDPTSLGVFEFFYDKDGAASSADKPVAFAVEGARCQGGVGLDAEGAGGGEGKDVVLVAVLGTDDEDNVLAVEADEVGSEAEGVGGGSAGAGATKGGTFESEGGDEVNVKGAGNSVNNA